MKGARRIFDFLLAQRGGGKRVALATITSVVGASPRSPGAHMAISEDGSYAGSFSGGCTEAAVVGEALRVLVAGTAETVRLGVGSPYIDIRLPCGGGLDILFTPDPAPDAVASARDALAERRPVALALGLDGSVRVAHHPDAGFFGDVFVVRHDPDLRLLIIGQGGETAALARLADAHGAEGAVWSPDAASLAEVEQTGAETHLLATATPPIGAVVDAYTAIIFLFHDHDWEIELLRWALRQEAFYIGAMGSRATHKRRVALLAAAGEAPAVIDRVVGPIGLIPAARDPDTLALSVLSEIVSRQIALGEAARDPSRVSKVWMQEQRLGAMG